MKTTQDASEVKALLLSPDDDPDVQINTIHTFINHQSEECYRIAYGDEVATFDMECLPLSFIVPLYKDGAITNAGEAWLEVCDE